MALNQINTDREMLCLSHLEDRRGTSWVWVSLCAEVYSLGKLGYSPAGGLMEAIGDYVGHPESTLRIKWMVQQSRADDGRCVPGCV